MWFVLLLKVVSLLEVFSLAVLTKNQPNPRDITGLAGLLTCIAGAGFSIYRAKLLGCACEGNTRREEVLLLPFPCSPVARVLGTTEPAPATQAVGDWEEASM